VRGGVIACGVPTSLPVVVLKFGSSVLSPPDGYRRAADEVAREVEKGHRVVAVVSAMGDTTDRLLEMARSLAAPPPAALLGQLLATGEDASVALLSIALTKEGVNVLSLPTERFRLQTMGALGDADPVDADTSTLAAALGTHDAVVLSGFVGRDASGAPSLLGRGGSDLTALFLGDALNATEVRLVKDVDGVYSEDPKTDERAVALTHATWDEVREIGGGVVQEKAIVFAQQRGRGFRVSSVGGQGTWVGLARGPRA
jgi:aspartokinase